jgi:hypothetical protein
MGLKEFLGLIMSTIIKSIEVVFRLPYLVALPDGEYQVSLRRRALQIIHLAMLSYVDEGKQVELSCEGHSVVRMLHPVDSNEARLDSEMKRCIGITLNDTNRLIQWYRYHTKHYYATEVVRQQISPIILYVCQDDEIIVYERDFRYLPPEPQPLTPEQIEGIKCEVIQSASPPTADLLLLDAQEALSKYRYREAILLAWIAIECAFDPFIREKLLKLVPDINFERDSAGANIEQDLHFHTRADVLLKALTGFSFRTETIPPFWEQLRLSRRHRNDITHRGLDAEEPEAQQAVQVAQQILRHIAELKE